MISKEAAEFLSDVLWEMSILDDADAEPQKEVPHFIDCLRDGRWAHAAALLYRMQLTGALVDATYTVTANGGVTFTIEGAV